MLGERDLKISAILQVTLIKREKQLKVLISKTNFTLTKTWEVKTNG